MKKLFGTDGIRGIANEFLNEKLTKKIGMALGRVLRCEKTTPTVILGTDTRASREMLASAISEGLTALGCDVKCIGVVPTPAVAYLTDKLSADAGIMISASHNSYEYNGIKIFGASGFKLDDALEEEIERLIFENDEKCDEIRGSITFDDTLKSYYIEHLRSVSPRRLNGLKIAIDCANGSAVSTAETLFTSLGAECHFLSDSPDGYNINEKCGSTHIEVLQEYVKAHKLDAGIAYDGDADRCIAVDERGEIVDGDSILAALALDMKQKGKLRGETLVGTIVSNLGLSKFCAQNGINFIPAAVGDRYVLEIINRDGYSLGGEQTGHVIVREFSTTGDGQLTSLLLLSLMAEKKLCLSELVSVMKRYPQYTLNIPADDAAKAHLASAPCQEIKHSFEEKLGESGRIIVRASGTEPLIRIVVEADTEELAEQTARELAEALSEKLR